MFSRCSQALTQSDEDVTQNDEARRHLCYMSLTGTEGHLRGVNKGTPALHHNDTDTHKNRSSNRPGSLECY